MVACWYAIYALTSSCMNSEGVMTHGSGVAAKYCRGCSKACCHMKKKPAILYSSLEINQPSLLLLYKTVEECPIVHSHMEVGLSFCWLQDTVIEEDKEFVTQYFDMPDTDFADMERMSPWLLRIELNREMLTDKGLNMSRIADTITSEFGEEMSVIFTDDNAPKHILRVSTFFQHK